MLLQLTILVILGTDKMIITQYLGPKIVTSYDVLFKYFSVLTMIHAIINAPLWSMYTEAYHKNDYSWLQSTITRMSKMIFVYIAIALVMYLFGDSVMKFWLGDVELGLTSSNYIYMAIMMIVLIWYGTFAFFSNGVGLTHVQSIAALIGALVNIPLSIVFVSYLGMGLDGVLVATIVSLSFFALAGPVHTYYVINKMKSDAEDFSCGI